MRTALLVPLLLLAMTLPMLADSPRPFADELAHTYSIVARDATTGELGVAVQTHWFAVGRRVPWAEAGVGAVATQSFTNASFGPRGLEMLRAGKSPQEVVDALIAADDGRDVRQLAVVDAKGRVAAWTGAKCIPAAGHQAGVGYSVQANLMRNDTVWPAMAAAFEKSTGPLAERLLAALAAAQAAGGDIRGKQSAALLVVAPESSGKIWEDRRIDLRVDDHADPVAELTRLVGLFRAYEHMNRGDEAIEAEDFTTAQAEYGAAEAMVPGSLEMRYWHAVALANKGKIDEALVLFGEVFAGDDSWRELTSRLPSVGLLEVSAEDLRRIVGPPE